MKTTSAEHGQKDLPVWQCTGKKPNGFGFSTFLCTSTLVTMFSYTFFTSHLFDSRIFKVWHSALGLTFDALSIVSNKKYTFTLYDWQSSGNILSKVVEGLGTL